MSEEWEYNTEEEEFSDWFSDCKDDLINHFIDTNEDMFLEFSKKEFQNHKQHMKIFKEDMARRYK